MCGRGPKNILELGRMGSSSSEGGLGGEEGLPYSVGPGMDDNPPVTPVELPPRSITITRVVFLFFLFVLAARLVLDGLTLANLALHPQGLLTWMEESQWMWMPNHAARVAFVWGVVVVDGILPFLTGIALLAAGVILLRKVPRGLAGLSLGLFLVAGWVGFLFNPLLFDLQFMAGIWNVSILPDDYSRLFSVYAWGWTRGGPRWPSLILMVPPLGATVAATAFLQFSLTFPKPIRLRARMSPGKNPDVGYLVRATLPAKGWLWPIAAAVFGGLLLGLLIRAYTPFHWAPLTWSRGLSFLVTLVFFLSALANLRHTLRTAKGEDRRRALSIAGGVLVFLFGAVLFLVVSFAFLQYADNFAIIPTHWGPLRRFLAVSNNRSVVASLAWLGTSAAFLYAIFGAGALDPSLAIRRSTVYGTLGALFLVLFAALESVLEDFAQARLGLSGRLGSMVAAGTIALVLVPFHKRLKRLAERVFPPEENG